MALLDEWKKIAYDESVGQAQLQKIWGAYFQTEKEIYAQLLKNPDEVVKGTVKELAEKYNVPVLTMTGFLDGINDSLVEKNPIEEMEEDTQVNLGFDKALLYKNMALHRAGNRGPGNSGNHGADTGLSDWRGADCMGSGVHDKLSAPGRASELLSQRFSARTDWNRGGHFGAEPGEAHYLPDSRAAGNIDFNQRLQ